MIAPPRRSRRREWLVIAAGVLLVVARLVLSRALLVQAIPDAGHDDALFLQLGRWLLHGRWLGPYDRLTLAKGPFYPMWIAATAALHVPLLAAQQALYAAACAVVVVAVRPVLPRWWTGLVLFTVLLFQPASFAAGPNTRVIREGIYPALTLLALGTAMGTAVRLSSRAGRLRAWAVASGASIAALWLTREEGVWVLPALAVIAAGPWCWRGGSRPVLRRAAAAGAIATIVFASAWSAVAARNWREYHAFLVNEFASGGFPRAYGALLRIDHAPRRYVPIPREVRHRAYAVSPAMAELEPFLEGAVGRGWTAAGCDALHVCDDLAGGWCMWALRDAASMASHARDAGAASAYWSRVARELDGACADGRLSCAPPRSGFLTPLRRNDLEPLARTVLHGAVYLTTLAGITSVTAPSPAVGIYPEMTHERYGPGAPRDPRRVALLEASTRAWRTLQPPAVVAAGLVWLSLGVAAALRRRRPTPLWWLAGAFLVAAATRVVLVSIVEYTSFAGINVLYLAPAYPLVVGFVCLVAAEAVAWSRAEGGAPPVREDRERHVGRVDTRRDAAL